MLMILQSAVTGDEITSHKLTHVDREASVLDASRLMRKAGTTELLVTGDANGTLRPLGIVTASDIVTRVIAAELDPAVLTAGDIAWCGIPAAGETDDGTGRLQFFRQDHGGALAILDGDGRLVGTMRLDEVMAAPE